MSQVWCVYNNVYPFHFSGYAIERISGGKPLAALGVAAGATWNNDTSEFRIACNATFPPLRIQFGRTEYLIPAKDLIHKMGGLAYCTLKVEIWPWAFGESMSDTSVTLNPNYCYSVDVGKNLVGFAPNLN